MTQRHRPIPVKLAKGIGEDYGYDIVIVFAADREAERNHCTTWGDGHKMSEEAETCGKLVSGIFGKQAIEELRLLRNRLNSELTRLALADDQEPTDEETPQEIDHFEIRKMDPPMGEIRWIVVTRLKETGQEAWLPLSDKQLAGMGANIQQNLLAVSAAKGPSLVVPG